MARRAIRVGAALAAVLTGSVALPHAAARGTTCETASMAAGTTAAGAVGHKDPERWWSFAGPPGTYLVTLASSIGDADLRAGDAACNQTCTSDNSVGYEVCQVVSTTNGITAAAWSMSPDVPASYVIEVTLLRPAALPDCADGVDNDGDGSTDDSDAGCPTALDPSEDDSPCYDVANVNVCVEPDPSGRDLPVFLTQPVFGKYEIVGYVETYTFDVGGKKVDHRCVVVEVEPRGTFNPCKFHGTFVSRDFKLYKPVAGDPVPTGALEPLYVCPATVTLKALATAPRTVDAYTLC